jgi:hypothetical protein
MSHHRHDDLPAWPALQAGDVVLLRSRRSATHTLTTVAGLLPVTPGDGPGLVDTQGISYRHFYFAADIPVTAADIDRSLDELATSIEKLRDAIAEQLIAGSSIDDVSDPG